MNSHTTRVGPVREAGLFRVRRIDYPPGLRQRRHSHDAPSVTLVLGGVISETTRLGEAVGSALSVVVKPAGVEHADEFGPRGARTIQIVFPAGADPADAPAGPWRWLHGAPATRAMLDVAMGLGARDGAMALEDRVLDAVAALGATGRDASAPGWLVRVREALDDELERGIGVRELAGLVGVHPVSVSRAFRRHYGVTVTEYRRRERTRRAAARIAGHASLCRIAHAAGYADQSHLCREFRRITGLSPSEFRRLSLPCRQADAADTG